MLPAENITPQTNRSAEEATAGCTSLLRGQEFSPYRKFKCVRIPVAIVKWPALPALARIVYGFLPSSDKRTRNFVERVGTKLGRFPRTIKRGLATLQQHGLAGRGGRFNDRASMQTKIG
jgi:hypothetical protein